MHASRGCILSDVVLVLAKTRQFNLHYLAVYLLDVAHWFPGIDLRVTRAQPLQ